MLWLKRALIALSLVLVVAILLTAIGYRKMHAVPDWYAQRTLNSRQLAAAADSAENKLINVQNWAAEQHARESARLHHGEGSEGAAAPAASRPANSTTLEFSEDELNAFFQKWVASTGWAERFGKYVGEPAIFLQDGRVILAGTVKDLGGTLASAHFEPKLDAKGNLDLRLVSVLGGKLPLPKAVWAAQRDKLAQVAGQQLPQWRRDASIAGNGTVNLPAISAGLTEALLHILSEQPSEPVIFLPVAGHGAIPARLTAVSVADKTLSLTVSPMTQGEREAFLARLKDGGPLTAMAR